MTTTDLLLSAWRFDPVAILGCAFGLAVYGVAGWPREISRIGYGTAAAIALAAALVSPVGALADGYLFSAHMLQHLLLLLVVPPLALLGLPASQTASTVRERGRFPLAPGAWLGGVAAMWLWHAPLLCNAATRSVGVHLAQEVSLLALGTWFFWPLLAPRADLRLPPLAGIAYLFTACIACTLLGVAVTLSPVEICAAYLFPTDRLGVLALLRDGWGLTPQRDQQIGGLLMWLPACLVYGVAILAVLARWYAEHDPDGTALPPRGQRLDGTIAALPPPGQHQQNAEASSQSLSVEVR
jgi:cytochrome c oxidase assembly factor CtaG